MTPTVAERVGVTEVQIDHLEQKLDDLKQDVHDMRTELTTQLKSMQEASTQQHGELAKKISEVSKFKDTLINYGTASVVILSFAGGIMYNIDKITHFFSVVSN
jgi:cell division protein FtsL